MTTKYWDAMKRPPASSLKNITGGRLRGMTDINPQWRLQAMTETFGTCGVGWKYTIEKMWLEAAVEDEVCAFVTVLVSVKIDGEWSAPIPGIGGSKLVEKEKSGPHTNDECFKMALTDALGVAMRALGVAADIYRGGWDGTKYRDDPRSEGNSRPNAEPQKQQAETQADPVYLNELKKAWLVWQFDCGRADSKTPKDTLGNRFRDFLPEPTSQSQLEAAWERLAESKAKLSDTGEITEAEEQELFEAVVKDLLSMALNLTHVNSAIEILNNDYTSDKQAKVIFDLSEARREEIRDGRGETSTQESEEVHG